MQSKRLLLPAVLIAGLFQLSACKTTEVLDNLGGLQVGGFTLTESRIGAIKTTAAAAEKAFTDLTPEQEYYIGRAVAASLLNQYRPYANDEANRYLNLLGRSLASFSDLPETFGGYHFLILDDDGINAFAAPGGLILVSRGLLRCCPDEDALAAVLAHEIGHVQLRHGLQAIKKSRYTNLFTVVAAEGAKQAAGQDLARLTSIFEDSIRDVTATLVNSGYSRAFEREADRAAVAILDRAGYDPHALVIMLTQMERRLRPGGLDFARTHPDPAERIAEIKPLLPHAVSAAGREARQPRFALALAGI